MIGEHELVQRIAVVVAEPVAPIIAAASKLGAPGLGIDQALVRPNAKIPTVDVHHGPSLDGLDPAAAVAVGAVDPVIESPREAVDAMLLIAFHEAGIERDAYVGLAITVGILGIENLRDRKSVV